MEAVPKWTYTPALRNGTPKAGCGLLKIRYAISEVRPRSNRVGSPTASAVSLAALFDSEHTQDLAVGVEEDTVAAEPQPQLSSMLAL